MNDTPLPPWFDKLIAPRMLILGVVLSFLGCCLAGHLTSRRNHLHHFERFHKHLSPESLYYPTALQVREMARNRFDRDKILVIVSGSSILHGTFQPVEQLWTDRLQAQLGDRYQVLNLALRAGRTTEIGAVAAEFLERDFKKLILIADVLPGYLHPEPDGFTHKYFFWDAYYKGLLLQDAAREERLAEALAEAERLEQQPDKERKLYTPPERQRELRTEKALDAALSFCDLWTTLAYARCHTLLTPSTPDSFVRPRKHCRDDEPQPLPLEKRFLPCQDRNVAQLRALLVQKCVRDAAHHWVEDAASPAWSTLERSARASFPEPTRRRTLLLATGFSPHHLRQLTDDERDCLAEVYRATVRHLEKLGFAALACGNEYELADYADFLHLTPSGGAKLADAVAPKVRALARQLGYE